MNISFCNILENFVGQRLLLFWGVFSPKIVISKIFLFLASNMVEQGGQQPWIPGIIRVFRKYTGNFTKLNLLVIPHRLIRANIYANCKPICDYLTSSSNYFFLYSLYNVTLLCFMEISYGIRFVIISNFYPNLLYLMSIKHLSYFSYFFLFCWALLLAYVHMSGFQQRMIPRVTTNTVE